MKITDRYRIALHNISNNKSRSILTTVIVYLMSFVIMALLFVSISYSSNMSKVTTKYVEDTLQYVTTDFLYVQKTTSDGNVAINKNNYSQIDKCLSKNEQLVDMVKFSPQQNSAFLTNYSFSLDEIIEVKQGAFPTKENKNTNFALVSEDFVGYYQEENGVTLSVGDSFTYPYSYYSLKEDKTYVENLSLSVGGVYSCLDKSFITSASDTERIITSEDEIIIDSEYLLNNFDKVIFTEGTFYSSTKKENISTKKLLKLEKKFVKELNEIVPKYEVSGKQEKAFYSLILNELKTYSIINYVVIGVASFMGVILIILSIGSLSNTIVISVNKNKKFIGLLKATGVRQKDLESIIRLESFTLITVGILLSSITLLAMHNVFVLINQKILNGTVSYLLSAINYTVTFNPPIYIPFIVLGFFLALTFLFSRTSIAEIAKEDPINVISEVS